MHFPTQVLHYRKPATVEKTLTRLPITHVVQLINVITGMQYAYYSVNSEVRYLCIHYSYYFIFHNNVTYECLIEDRGFLSTVLYTFYIAIYFKLR